MSFDFDAAVTAPFRMQPGLRRMAPSAVHLTPLAPGSRQQREKLAVLSAFSTQALLQRPGFDAIPALDALCALAAREHPQSWAWDGSMGRAMQLGVGVINGEVKELAQGSFGLGDEITRCLLPLPANWRLAALLNLAFVEDFAIVDAADGSIPWLAVTLPSHWAPEEKVGRHFAHVHAPVADNALLISASASLMKMVTEPQAWERFVWNVTGHPRLHAHPERVDARRWPAELNDVAAQAWWRSERQTFIPLPAQRQAIFTIAVDLVPLADAIHSPARAARLFDAISTMSPAVLDYRGLSAVREPLLQWLAAARGAK